MATERPLATAGQSRRLLRERVGRAVPDPAVIFIVLFVVCTLATHSLSQTTFTTVGGNGELVTHSIRNMVSYEGVAWMFDNALVNNWLMFGGGVLGSLFAALVGVGIAEESGLLTAVVKSAGSRCKGPWLPFLVVFLGMVGSFMGEVAYLILIPLVGSIYAGLQRNPVVGMATAFAGVSAGLCAHVIPGLPMDVILGQHGQAFAIEQGVPFVRANGEPLHPATMHYWFLCVSMLVVTVAGGLVTVLFVNRRWRSKSWVQNDRPGCEVVLIDLERYGLRWAKVGGWLSCALILWLVLGPLAGYYDADGHRVTPWLNQSVVLVALVLSLCGVLFGAGTGGLLSTDDVVKAINRQLGTMGYILVLTFFCYNFLSLMSYSGVGAWVVWLGASSAQMVLEQAHPVTLLLGCVGVVAVLNLFIGGLTAKWLLLGPAFVPVLYRVNSEMTPDWVALAFRVADASTNMVAPTMVYGGVVLAFMRRYRPDLSPGDLIGIMLPYSLVFLAVWCALLVLFYCSGWALGL